MGIVQMTSKGRRIDQEKSGRLRGVLGRRILKYRMAKRDGRRREEEGEVGST